LLSFTGAGETMTAKIEEDYKHAVKRFKPMIPAVGQDPQFFDDTDPHPLVPNKSFFALIIGGVGSGKSFVVHNILSHKQMLKRAFNWVFLISPSPKDLALKIPHDRITKVFDTQWIAEKVEWCRDQIRTALRKDPKKTIADATPATLCFVFDDAVAQIRRADTKGDPLLTELFYNRRHLFDVTGADGVVKHLLSASIIVTTQQFKMLPLKFRQVSTWVMSFTELPEQMKSIYHETVFGLTWDAFKAKFERAFAKKHGLIQIRLDVALPLQVREGLDQPPS
jgi:hypothetical protein